MRDRQKLWWLGFVHLIAMPFALAAGKPWGVVYCIGVAFAVLIGLHVTRPTPRKQGRD